MNKNIFVVGESRQDVFLSNIPGLEIEYDGVKPFNKLLLDHNFDLNFLESSIGGSGANVAVAFSRWGYNVKLLSQIGNDWLGDHVLKVLDEEAIDTSLVNIADLKKSGTSCAFRILDLGLNKQSIISYSGKCLLTNFSKITIPNDVEWMFCGTAKGDFELLNDVFTKAKNKDMKIMFNPGPKELADMHKTWGLLEDVDILLVNQQEAIKMVNDSVMESAVKKLCAFVDIAIITDANDGVIVCDSQKIWRAGVYRPDREVDRTGVGDAFASGFLYKYLTTQNMAEAISFGSANAASVVSKFGAQTGILELESEVHELMVRERSV